MTPNPFNSSEPLEEVFEQTHNYHVTRDNALSAFKQQYHPQSQSTKQSNFFSTMFSRLTTTTLAGLTTAFTLFGGLTLTQVYAQEEYKPLTIAQNLFSANKQDDRSPEVALTPNDDSYLVYVEPCNVGLKYPKVIEDNLTSLSELKRNTGEQIGVEVNAGQEIISLTCFEKDLGYGFFGNDGEVTFQPVTLVELQQTTGWFISATELENLRWETTVLEDATYKDLKFELNDLFYSVSTNSNQASLENLSAIQLQFADQVDLASADQPVYEENNTVQPGSCGEYEINTEAYALKHDSIISNYTVRTVYGATPLNSPLYNTVFLQLSCSPEIDGVLKQNMKQIDAGKLTDLVEYQLENTPVYAHTWTGGSSKVYVFQDTYNNWITVSFEDTNGYNVDWSLEDNIQPILK